MEEYRNILRTLKTIRQEKKISLEEIAEKTKIRMPFLQAIENGEIEKIPSVYDKLFLQAYLTAIKVDDKAYYLEAFRQLRNASESRESTTITSIRPPKTDQGLLFRKRVLIVAVPVLLAAIMLIIFALTSEKIITADSGDIKELPVRAIARDIETRNQMRLDSIALATQKARIPDVLVTLKAVEVTWLRLVKDRADTSEMLLQVKDSVTVKADSLLQFLVGKANGIDFIVNGKKEGILGQRGEVITNLSVTRNGIITKNVKPAKKNVPEEAVKPQ